MAQRKQPQRRPRGAASPTSARRVRAAAKQAQALNLREAGASYETIAQTAGYRNRSSARKAVLAGLKAAQQEPAELLRQLELRRLDKLSLQLWPAALARPADYAAIDRVLKIIQQRAALLGLNVQKLALTDPSGEEERCAGGVQLVNLDWSALKEPTQLNVVEERIEEAVRNALTHRADPAGGQGDQTDHQSSEDHGGP